MQKNFSISLLLLIFVGPILHLEAQSAEDAFTEIYEKAIWGKNEKGEGCSGMGSSPYVSWPYMQALQEFLDTHNIETVVDLGCGDWEFSQYINWDKVIYIGFDVVKSVIEKNQKKFSSHNILFFQEDCTNIDLPQADLLICKDVFQHLPHKDILKILIQMPKFQYCLFTNDIDSTSLTSKNIDIDKRGGWRTLDLTCPPFNLKGKKLLTYKAQQSVKQVLLITNSL